MLSTLSPTARGAPRFLPMAAQMPQHDSGMYQRASRKTADTLELLAALLAPEHRVVRAGETVYQAGEGFGKLYILNSGFFKMVNLSADGREQVVGLKFRGDWLGFDGIANDRYACDAVAMDTGEVWVVRYEALLEAFATKPALVAAVHEAMSREIGRDRDFAEAMTPGRTAQRLDHR